MNLAYVTIYDAADIAAWSGLGFHIARCLEEQVADHIDYIGSLKSRDRLFLKLRRNIYTRILKQNFEHIRTPLVARYYAEQISEKLAATDAEIVFCPTTIPIAYLKCRQPIVFWVDATFAGLLNFYPGWDNIAREAVYYGHRIEQAALDNCRLALFSSEWAAQTALDNYHVDPAKVHVVPFGANLSSEKSRAGIEAVIESRPRDVCRLLFLGVDWERKGGALALAAAAELTRMGLKTELHIAGCDPPSSESLPDYIITHGHLSKSTEEGRAKIESLIAGSHFLILPTRAECLAVVIAEANSLGVPAISTNVGGVPTAIRDGINGQKFDLAASPEEYAEYIFRTFSDYDGYRKMAMTSLDEYSERLNWKTAGETVKGLLSGL